ncbi:PREDICTED: diuretic hormone class 2 isoform X3 [Papilio polytes]|uniref:diuretic hormone class 2 isoform X3 n=1 Tax=Papilio polytes TaxID=76194 RepID=UPI000675BE36|nr:PREDICTED: diuretic hormone class 2 isoform X3 [Papilio polytes]
MVRPTCLLVCCLLGALMLVVPAASYPRFVNDYRQDVAEDPEEIREMLSRLESLIQLQRQMDYEKRALDLGLTRGYSGALQAKHLMGLAAANFAGGPGRRRRDAH